MTKTNKQLELNEQGEILCPECGLNYNHLTEVNPVKYSDSNEPGGQLKFQCENGHVWQLSLYNYKGRMMAETEYLSEAD